MHIPDGFVNGAVNASTFAASAAVCAYSVRKLSREMDERKIPLIGVTAAFIFAAQMLNFPVAAGTSGHFLGAALAAILLGPWAATLIMALVLIIQALGFADGGLTALGSNIFNMGVIGVFSSYAVFTLLMRILPRKRSSFFAAASVASWCSIVLAATACAVELALSGTSPFGLVVPAMAGVHAIIGLGEAVITSAVLMTVLSSRADLLLPHLASGWQPSTN